MKRRFLTRFLAAIAVVVSVFAFLPPKAVLSVNPLPYDWYRYQGEADSGPKASINCEVTSVAMAIQYARNNLWVPIASIREYIGKEGLTSTADAQRALQHWGVPYADVNTAEDIIAALNRGHIVIVGLMMNTISPGADYEKGSSDPSQRFGRYYAFDGAHSVVVKGITPDQGWFIVYDPNGWDGNPIYWYADGSPKGKDRYYPVGEFAQGMATLGDNPKGLEILASPNWEYPRLASDLAVLGTASPWWRSVTFAFSLTNPRDVPFIMEQIGVQGKDPSGQDFFAPAHGLKLGPGATQYLAIPLATSQPGTWRAHRILYYAEGQWRELSSTGYRQRAEFTVQ
jgi:hypothetical protein